MSAYDDDYDYGYYESSNSAADVAMSGGGIFDGFTQAASQRYNQMVGSFNSGGDSTASLIGSSLFQAIYEFGAGKIDAAKTRLGYSLLGSRSADYYASQSQVGIGVALIVIIAIAGVFFLRK